MSGFQGWQIIVGVPDLFDKKSSIDFGAAGLDIPEDRSE
jgi:hypothetical protein